MDDKFKECEKSMVFDGVRFTKSNGKNYHYNTRKRKHLHQYVWEYYNGDIPNGYEIHHKDCNAYNNHISNLEMLLVDEHKKIHADLLKKDVNRIERMKTNLNENARHKASEWHKSEEGKKWHREQFAKVRHKMLKPIDKECEFCNNKYTTTQTNSRFCSNKCKSAWRRKEGLDNIEKECEVCGKTFGANKYSNTKTCSKSCASIKRWRDKSN